MRPDSPPLLLFKQLRFQRFKALLVALFLLLVATPVASALGSKLTLGESRGVITVFFGLTVFAAAGAAADNRRTVWRVSLLGALCLVLDAVRFMHDAPGWHAAFYICGMMYLLFVIYLLLKHVFCNRIVTTDTIAAALCVYLLIGITWALGYSLIDTANPDAFHFAEETASGRTAGAAIRFGSGDSASAVYFSFVTLCTLGYGDIFPKSPTAEMAAIGEAIVGQLYLAVLVARLVGLHIAGTGRDENGQVKFASPLAEGNPKAASAESPPCDSGDGELE
jgi:voltage-gated potassium channel